MLMCVHAGRREPRVREHGEKKKTTSKTPQRHRRASRTKRAGSGGTGRSKEGRQGTAGGAKKNHSTEEQFQQRRVITWGNGKGHGGRGGREEGPTTGPDGKTPRNRKGAGRGRTVLGSRTGPGKAAWARAGELQAAQKKQKRKNGIQGKGDGTVKGQETRSTRPPQGTWSAWEVAQE